MAVSVVENLEMVDVEHRQRKRRLAAPSAAELPQQGLVEILTVEQSGERISNGLRAQDLHHPRLDFGKLLLVAFAFGDVGADTDPLADRAVLFLHRHATHAEIPIFRIMPAQPVLRLEDHLRAHGGRPGGDDALAVARVKRREPTVALDRFGRLSGEASPGWLVFGHLSVGVGRPDDLRDSDHERAVALLAEPQCLFRPPPGADRLRLGQCPLQRGRQTRQPVLQDIIVGAGLDEFDRGLIPQHAGDQNHRQGGGFLARAADHGEAVETRQPAIGQHDIGIEPLERPDKCVPRLHPLRAKDEPRLTQGLLDQLSVRRYVLDDEDPQVLCRRHRGFHSIASGPDRRAAAPDSAPGH